MRVYQTLNLSLYLRRLSIVLGTELLKFALHCLFITLASPLLCGIHLTNPIQVIGITAGLWFGLIISGCYIWVEVALRRKILQAISPELADADEYKRRRLGHQAQEHFNNPRLNKGHLADRVLLGLKFSPSVLCRTFLVVWLASLALPWLQLNGKLLPIFYFSLAFTALDRALSAVSPFIYAWLAPDATANKSSVDRASQADSEKPSALAKLQDDASLTFSRLDLEIQMKPNAEAFLKRGKAHLEHLDLIPAIDDLDKAIEMTSNFAQAYEARGDVFRQMRLQHFCHRDYDQACRMFLEQGKADHHRRVADKLNELRLKSPLHSELNGPSQVLNGLAAIFFPSKIEALTKSNLKEVSTATANTDIKTAGMYVRQADLLLRNADYTAAMEACQRALEINPQTAEAYQICGDACVQLLDTDTAMKNYDKAISIDEHNEGAYKGRANLNLIVYEDYKAVIDDCTFAMTFSKSYQFRLLRGKAYLKVGDFEKSIADLTDFIDTWNGFIKLWDSLWLPLFREIAHGLRDELIDAYEQRALAYDQCGNLDKAAHDLAQAAKVQNKLPRKSQIIKAP